MFAWGAGSQGPWPRERSQLDKRHRGVLTSLSPGGLFLPCLCQFCEPPDLTFFPA